MKFRPTLVALSLGLSAAVTASSVLAEGNAERGKVLAYTCHGCHGVPNYKNAYPNYSVPRLGGQNAEYVEAALKAYASGERPHQTMHSQAVTLSDQDRADIAAFVRGQGVKPVKQVVGTPPPTTQTCVTCHGKDGATVVSPEYPILAGQQADYIVQALRDYKSGKRKNPIMAGIIGGIDPRDFDALAQYFASQPGLCSTDRVRDEGRCGEHE